ncbi:hypothetical protein KR059_002513 [Drosophila kikkawai]|nr:hypothetical protein KR059_002513 [Drosophila kikkawai]
MSAPKNTECETPTVREVQQMFAELLCHGDHITWDLLAVFIAQLINHFQLSGQFNNGQSLSALFFVMIVENISDPKEAEESRSWSLYPVFRCRRCVGNNRFYICISSLFSVIPTTFSDDNTGRNFSSQECCMVYVTQYESFEDWDKFVKSTRLPKGYMVTPFRGVYKLIDGQVELKTYYIWERSNTVLPTGQDRCITPKSLAAATKCPSHGGSADKIRVLDVLPTSKLCLFFYLTKYSPLLQSQREGQKSSDASELSDSLLLFTHTTKNLQLALDMIKEQSYRNVLGNELKKHFDKIAEESERIEGRVNLIRSANEVPPRHELDKLFSTKRKRIQEPSEASNPPLDLTTIRVKGEAINLEDYGSALKEHIISSESFENLIICMSEHLEPEMFKIIVKLTQHFMEIIREGLWHLLKYHIPTETVLYRIILDVIENHPELNFKEVEEQSSDVLKRVRLNFVLANPNSNPDFLTKCPKCGNFFDKFVNKFA